MKDKIIVKKLTDSDFEQFKQVLYVFRESPWNEELNDKQVEDEWNSYKKQDLEYELGVKEHMFIDDSYSVFGTFVNGKMVSMAAYTITHGDDQTHIDHDMQFSKNETIGYISGLATIAEYRGHGYGSMALNRAVEYFEYLGIDKSYGRYAVSLEEIEMVNNNYDAIVNGFKYISKSESIGMLKKAGYKEFFTEPGKLFAKDYGNAEWKVEGTDNVEDIRAIAIMEHTKYKSFNYQEEMITNKQKSKALVPTLLQNK